MGQFFVASSADAQTTKTISSQAEKLAHQLFGAPAESRPMSDRCHVMELNRVAGQRDGGEIHGSEYGDKCWSVGAGTWIHRDSRGTETATAALASRHSNLESLKTAVGSIDGSFCFVTGTRSGDMIRVITDPVGQLHVYWLVLPNALLISTSALLLAQLGQCSWEPPAVREFLATGTVFEDRSLFQDVRKVTPASIHTFKSQRSESIRTYWSVHDHANSSRSAKESLDAFATSIGMGIQHIFEQFQRPALDITGGFDSRLILASVRNQALEQDFGTTIVGAQNDADVVSAQRIVDVCGLNHRRIDAADITPRDQWNLARAALPLTDGECNMLEYATIMHVHRTLSSSFGISVNGSGGELIRGYWWELLFPHTGRRGRFDSSRVAWRRFATDAWAEGLVAESFGTSLGDHFAQVIERANSELRNDRNTACMDNVYLRLRMQRWQGRIASATNHIWPCISPLMFRGAMEAALSAPISLRRNGRMARRLLATLDRRLAALPMAGGYPALPINLATLPQFAPLGREYLRRAGQRLTRPLAKFSPGRKSLVTPSKAPILQEQKVVDLLDPKSMLTSELYDSKKLDVASAAMKSSQVPLKHTGRVLTLEALARLRRQLPEV